MANLVTSTTAAWLRARMGEGRGADPTRLGRGPRDADLGPPWGPLWPFGLTVAGASVTIHPGGLEAAGAYYLSIETTIVMTGTGQYVGLAHDRSAGSLTVTGPHNSRPVSSGDVYRTALYLFDFEGGIAMLSRCCLWDIRLEAIT